MRRITRKPWFGPKRYAGRGWGIRSWQGGVVTVALVGLVVADLRLLGRTLGGLVGVVVLAAAWLLVVLLTGTGPGGPGL